MAVSIISGTTDTSISAASSDGTSSADQRAFNAILISQSSGVAANGLGKLFTAFEEWVKFGSGLAVGEGLAAISLALGFVAAFADPAGSAKEDRAALAINFLQELVTKDTTGSLVLKQANGIYSVENKYTNVTVAFLNETADYFEWNPNLDTKGRIFTQTPPSNPTAEQTNGALGSYQTDGSNASRPAIPNPVVTPTPQPGDVYDPDSDIGVITASISANVNGTVGLYQILDVYSAVQRLASHQTITSDYAQGVLNSRIYAQNVDSARKFVENLESFLSNTALRNPSGSADYLGNYSQTDIARVSAYLHSIPAFSQAGDRVDILGQVLKARTVISDFLDGGDLPSDANVNDSKYVLDAHDPALSNSGLKDTYAAALTQIDQDSKTRGTNGTPPGPNPEPIVPGPVLGEDINEVAQRYGVSPYDILAEQASNPGMSAEVAAQRIRGRIMFGGTGANAANPPGGGSGTPGTGTTTSGGDPYDNIRNASYADVAGYVNSLSQDEIRNLLPTIVSALYERLSNAETVPLVRQVFPDIMSQVDTAKAKINNALTIQTNLPIYITDESTGKVYTYDQNYGLIDPSTGNTASSLSVHPETA